MSFIDKYFGLSGNSNSIDAFIGNNDRNNRNWGILWNNITGNPELAPVYDNGNAFFNKRSLKQMEKRLGDASFMHEDAYGTPASVYKYTDLDNERQIHPFKYIKESGNQDCRDAVSRFLKRIDMKKVEALIKGIPESTGNLAVMPNIQKEFYLELLNIRLEQLMLST